ncbi:MAG: DNA primase [Bacteroidota bacterium]
MYIGEDKIASIRAATDIVDVVGEYVRLKPKGSNYFGLCPFHDEKSPSFSVNPSLGIYKCFGCGVGGDVYSFVQRIESVTFVEAARLLAERAGIDLPEESAERDGSSEAESIYHALRFAGRYFYEQLTQTESGRKGLAYLMGRGFTAPTIKQFGLGYARPAWDALLQAATKAQLKPDMLEKAGLVIPRREGQGHYDRYRGRVLFPIFSHVGKVLGFGGRILDPDDDQPKYINSPETRVYHKSQVLYGLYQAKQEIRRREEVLLVEGYTDVIALHQAQVTNVVATCGTALTEEQLTRLKPLAKRLVLLYDGDAAGANAALRAMDLALAHGLSVYAVALPEGSDPDSYVREQGGDAFRDYLEQHRQNFIAFRQAYAERTGQLDTPEGKSAAVQAAMASVARIPDEVARAEYVRLASAAFSVLDSVLFRVLDRAVQDQRPRSKRRAPVPPPPPDPQAMAPPVAQAEPLAPRPATLPEENVLVRLMVEHGGDLVEFIMSRMALDEFTEGVSRTVVEALLAQYQDGAIDPAPFLRGSHGEAVQAFVAEVLSVRHEPSARWQASYNIRVPRRDEDPEQAAISAMMLLKLDRVDEAIQQTKRRMYEVDLEDEALLRIQSEVIELQKVRKQIQNRAFLDW